jgi:hypothetical protein
MLWRGSSYVRTTVEELLDLEIWRRILKELHVKMKYWAGRATCLKRKNPVQNYKGRTLSKTMYQEVESTYLKRRTCYKGC